MKGIALKAKRVFVVALITIILTGVVPVQAASVWSFTAGSGKKITVNGTVEFKKNEYQNINLFKGGKEIKENDKTYKVTWSSSDTDVVWINKNSGQMRADKYKKITKSTATAKITATIKNKKTGAVAKRSFTAKVVGNNMSSIPSPTPTSTPSPVAHTIYDGTTVELSKAKVGDVVLFGVYEQDNIKSNGAEAIPWYVLDRDGDKLLLMSVYLLDCIKNNEKYTNITWEDCTLRQWMNNEFYNSAFTKSEKKHILTSYLKNEDNPFYRIEGGNDTEDKVFALSLEEVTQYFGIADKIAGGSYWVSAAPELSGAEVTAYAEAQGAYVSTVGNGWWRLRSSGSFDGDVAYIDDELIALGSYDGVLYVRGESVVRSSNAARPALWLELNSSVATPTPTNTPAVNTAESVINKKNVKVGSYITLGSFEQDNWEANGKEAVEWQVLEVQDDKALVISKYGLINRPYDNFDRNIWKECDLRRWLNTEFLETVFSPAEQRNILKTEVKNVGNVKFNVSGGEDTVDKLFLLSLEELEKYFPSSVYDEAHATEIYKSRHTPPTPWALNNGCAIDVTDSCIWWLRTPGGLRINDSNTVQKVNVYGYVWEPGWPVSEGSYAVRPAMWVKLDGTASATAAPSPLPTATPSPIPTATPTPMPTAIPTSSPTVTKIYGTLDLTSVGWSSYSVGVNADFSGGTHGKIYQDAKLEILEECTNAKGTLVYKVYSLDLGKECYVTAKYVKVDSAVIPPQTEPVVSPIVIPEVKIEENKKYGTLDLTSVGWSSYSVGVNADFTGGTHGKIKQDAKLEILEECTNSKGTLVYKVYSYDLEKECYVTAKYVKVSDGAAVDSEEQTPGGVYGATMKMFNTLLDSLNETKEIYSQSNYWIYDDYHEIHLPKLITDVGLMQQSFEGIYNQTLNEKDISYLLNSIRVLRETLERDIYQLNEYQDSLSVKLIGGDTLKRSIAGVLSWFEWSTKSQIDQLIEAIKKEAEEARKPKYVYNDVSYIVVEGFNEAYFFNQMDYPRYIENGDNVGCTATALATAYSIYNNTLLSPGSSEIEWVEDGVVWGPFTKKINYYSTDLLKVYDLLTQNIPVIIRLKGGKGHSVTVVGIKEGVNRESVSTQNLLVVDPNGGKVHTLTQALTNYVGLDSSWRLIIPEKR